jgi:hypothetical protein
MRVYLESYTCFSVLILENATTINLEWMDYLHRHILVCIFTDLRTSILGPRELLHISVLEEIFTPFA